MADTPTADQIRAYLLAHGWRMGESGSAAYLMVALGHTVRMLHEPTEYDRGKAVFDISLAERRHPADVRDDILAGPAATQDTSHEAMTGKSDVPALVAFLRQRRIDLGLTQREVADHAPRFTTSLLCGYETGHHKPSAEKLVAWADALGCDVTLTPRPAPPARTRFDSLDELRQDLHDNARARRVAAPATPDGLDELRRRLDEGRAVIAARTRVEIDPNVRCRGNQTRTGVEDCHGPVAVGDEVTVYESEAAIEGWGQITDIDYDKQLVYLKVNWAGLHDMEESG